MDYFNPTPPQIANGINLDRLIEQLRIDLQNRLFWLDLAFGRVYRARRVQNVASKNAEFYPETLKGQNSGNRYIDLSPNDKLGNYCFFYTPDPVEHGTVENPADPSNFLANRVFLIFWGNLDLISTDLNYRFTELLKEDVRFVLRDHTDFIISREFEEPDQVFKEFDIRELNNQFFKNPYYGLRFELSVSYLPDCNTALNTYS